MSRYVKARPGPRNSVIYTDADGKEWVFSGGDRVWRNNNPGNLVPGKVSKRNGAIGSAGGFAVFPDYEAGHKALLDCLKTTFGNSDIKALLRNYAPPHQNDTAQYERFLRSRTGMNDNRKVRDFTPAQFEALWKAIEDMEGKRSNKGNVKPLTPRRRITRVRKNKKRTIVAYFIEGLGWVSKDEGIALAQSGKIDAVVATSRKGNLFLKARPDRSESNNLKNLG